VRRGASARTSHYPDCSGHPRSRCGTTLFGADGAPLISLRPGDELVARIEVDAQERLDEWLLGISIDTALGQTVFGTDTKLMRVALLATQGKRTTTVRIPNLQLGEGTYGDQAAIAESSGVEIDRLAGAATFNVESDGSTIGVVHARAEFGEG
jgi:ABC-2 type transport system ATP-binding protein